MFKKYFNSLDTRKKIFVSILCVSFLAQVFTGILGCVGIMKCSDGARMQSDELGVLVQKNAESAMKNQSRDMLSKSASQIAENADLLLAQTENKVQNLCNLAENAYLISPENVGSASNSQIFGYVINNEENSGTSDNISTYENNNLPENLGKEFKILSTVSSVAGSIYKSSEEIAELYIATETGIVYKSGSEKIDVRATDWYKKAKESARSGQKQGAWNAYSSGDKSHIVFSKAFFDRSGKICGIVAADLYAEKVCGRIINAVNYDDKYVFVFDNGSGKIISNYDNSSEFFIGFDEPSESYKNLVLSLKNGESGAVDVSHGDEEYLTAYAPIKSVNWSAVIADKPSSADVSGREIKENLLNEIENSNKKSGTDISSIIFKFLIIFCSFGIVIYALCRSVAKKILPNIESVENDAEKFRKLSAELEMAEKIQKSMLPEASPSNLKRDDMEIYASSVPAEEVGGDFYDFFFIDDNHLALVIADAADKGVPAAMYMSATKKLIKNKLTSTKSLSASLESVNDSL